MVGNQAVGVGDPAQGVGQVAAFLLDHTELAAGAGGAEGVIDLFKGAAGLVVPVIGHFQVALFVVDDAQLAGFDADAAPVAHLLAVFHSHAQPFLGFVGDAPGLGQEAEVVKCHDHLPGHTEAVGEAQGLLVPGLGFLKEVFGMVHGAEGVKDVDGGFLVPVFLDQFAGAVIPAAGFVVFKAQVAGGAEGAEVVDHFLVVGQTLVDVQGAGVPFFGGAVLPLVVAHLADGEAGVGDGFLVIAAVDDFQALFQPLGGIVEVAPAGGDESVLVIDGGGAGVGGAVGLGQQVVQQAPVVGFGAVQVHNFYGFHGVGAEEVLPEVDGAVAFGLGGGVADGVQQLGAEAAQFGEAFLHPVHLRQGLDEQLGVVPLAVFQGQAQGLGEVAFLGQDGGDAGVLVFVEAFHKVVGGVGIDADEFLFQAADALGGYLASQLASQEPGQGGVNLVHAGGYGFQEAGGLGLAQKGAAGGVGTAG